MLLTLGNTDIRKLIGGDSAGVPITQIVVGDGNTPITGNETGLSDQLIKAITTVDYSLPGIILFIAMLGPTDPAMTIREMGLINANGVLCFRTLVTDKVKVSGLTYNLNYHLQVQ